MAKDNERTVELESIFGDMERYENAMVYGRLLNSKDETLRQYADGALYNSLKDLGMKAKKEGDLEGLVSTINASRQSQERYLSVFVNQFQEAREKLTIGEMYEHYKGDIESDIGKDDMTLIEKALDKYKDMSLSSINKKIQSLRYKAENPTDEDEANEAKEELEEYKSVMYLISKIDDVMYSKNLHSAIDEASKMRSMNYVKELKSKTEDNVIELPVSKKKTKSNSNSNNLTFRKAA